MVGINYRDRRLQRKVKDTILDVVPIAKSRQSEVEGTSTPIGAASYNLKRDVVGGWCQSFFYLSQKKSIAYGTSTRLGDL